MIPSTGYFGKAENMKRVKKNKISVCQGWELVNRWSTEDFSAVKLFHMIQGICHYTFVKIAEWMTQDELWTLGDNNVSIFAH